MILAVAITPEADHYFTKAVSQYSRNIQINLTGIEVTFPVVFSVSNSDVNGNAVTYKSDEMPFSVPNVHFLTGDYVYIWVRTPAPDSKEYMITIPVNRRPVPVYVTEEGDPSGSFSYDYYPEEENLILTMRELLAQAEQSAEPAQDQQP